MPLGNMPVSPYKNMNEITPTRGGSTNGNTASDENISLPGKRYLVNINARGMPTKADNITLPTDIKMLLLNASRFDLFCRLKNSL